MISRRMAMAFCALGFPAANALTQAEPISGL